MKVILRKRGRPKDYGKRCFEAAHDFASMNERLFRDNTDAVIVHGYVEKMEGVYFCHAWCEVGEKAYDLTDQKPEWEREEYYRKFNIRKYPHKKYSLREFFQACLDIRKK